MIIKQDLFTGTDISDYTLSIYTQWRLYRYIRLYIIYIHTMEAVHSGCDNIYHIIDHRLPGNTKSILYIP